MHIEGSHLIRGPRHEVWDALHDPAVLVTAIPGCLALRQDGASTFTATVEAGIASLTGVYEGHVALQEQVPPSQYVLTASGQGGPGTIDARVLIRLADADGQTLVTYDAEAVVGGAIAGVGQRVVAGVARRSAAQFFTAIDAHLLGDPTGRGTGAPAAGDVRHATADRVQPAPAATAAGTGGTDAVEGAGTVFRPPAREAGDRTDPVALLLAAATGAAIALLGVVLGRLTARP